MRLSYLRIYGLFDDFMYQEESCPNIRILKIGERMEQPRKNRHLVDNPREIGRFFREFVPENPAKFDFFFRDLPEALSIILLVTFRLISQLWDNAHTLNLENCLLYLSSIISKFLGFIMPLHGFSFDFFIA